MSIRQLFDQDTFTFTYLVVDPTTKQAALIDPVLGQVERDLKLISELGLKLALVLDTHVHADHITGSGLLRERTGARVVASERGAACADTKVKQGDEIHLGETVIAVLETPGHTDDSLSYRIGDNVFTGDALLVRGTGRTDFQNGDSRQLWDSIQTRLFTLPENTVVWPGHDYRGHTSSTIAEEKQNNPRLSQRTFAEFNQIMAGLKLPPPRYIDQAVPANRECGLGLAPEAGSDGFREATAGDALELSRQKDTVVLDVREPHEFAGELGHIQGAINLPHGTVSEAALDLSFDTPLLIVCRSGRRSRGVCRTLVRRGFRNVTNLSGGMLEMASSGR